MMWSIHSKFWRFIFLNLTPAINSLETFTTFTAMKFSSILLSIVLIVLSCLPCADAESNAEPKSDAKLVVDNHADHSKEQNTDFCSPFCICNCCGAQILNFTPSVAFTISEVQFPEYSTKTNILYKAHFASMFSGSIWQPPQLS